MLSILITIYNYNLYPVVQELHKQCNSLDIEFEILTQDDASNSKLNIENEKINSLSNCNFTILTKNVGYRENKNLLVQKSKYDNLIIMDGDCSIISNSFIKDYVQNIGKYDAVYGGRKHSDTCPSGNQKLRWKYGKFIEDKLSIDRLKKPFQSLLFNNILISKNCFNQVKFDSSFTKYGHDDTQFSYQLLLHKSNIHHIENPVEHNDIDTNLVYINKTKNSLENLRVLFDENKIDKKYVRIMYLVFLLQKVKVSFLITSLYSLFEKRLMANLKGKEPSLFAFNLFRIGYLCQLKQ
ncbi:glycosyltransferase [Flavobacterium algicola]|uniref:glycosyltransferase n=1 Tax=Flavobacterium algicola TaxID=556529 RepID=UPI001EFD72D2|nr:glycosyltransferase [Flavobacterium algicola]MCG9793652.1 glycosyltransferase [Flavobacterium algicola]